MGWEGGKSKCSGLSFDADVWAGFMRHCLTTLERLTKIKMHEKKEGKWWYNVQCNQAQIWVVGANECN